ncbi:MAG: hypothetical protein AAGF12_37620 [Myxococcota bacterium]
MPFQFDSLHSEPYRVVGRLWFAQFVRYVPLHCPSDCADPKPILSQAQLRALHAFELWDEMLSVKLGRASFAAFAKAHQLDPRNTPKIESSEEIWNHLEPLSVEIDEASSDFRSYLRVRLRSSWGNEGLLEWVVRDDRDLLWVGPDEANSIERLESRKVRANNFAFVRQVVLGRRNPSRRPGLRSLQIR